MSKDRIVKASSVIQNIASNPDVMGGGEWVVIPVRALIATIVDADPPAPKRRVPRRILRHRALRGDTHRGPKGGEG